MDTKKQTFVGQGFNVMASIGGWNFPSHYFSETVYTDEQDELSDVLVESTGEFDPAFVLIGA